MERHGYDGHRARPFRSRSGMVMGVCKGLAEHLDFSVFWIRVAVVALAAFTEFWPVVIAYVALGLFMRSQPRQAMVRSEETPPATRTRHAMEGLDKRMRRLEDVVTSRRYDWDERLERGH